MAAEVDGRFGRVIGIVYWRWRWDFLLRWQIFVMGEEWYGNDGWLLCWEFFSRRRLMGGFIVIIGSVDESWDGIIFAANAILQWGDEWYSSVVSPVAAELDGRLGGIVLWRRRLMGSFVGLLGV